MNDINYNVPTVLVKFAREDMFDEIFIGIFSTLEEAKKLAIPYCQKMTCEGELFFLDYTFGQVVSDDPMQLDVVYINCDEDEGEVIYEKQDGFVCLSIERFLDGIYHDVYTDKNGHGYYAEGLNRSVEAAVPSIIKAVGYNGSFTHVHWFELGAENDTAL